MNDQIIHTPFFIALQLIGMYTVQRKTILLLPLARIDRTHITCAN